MINEFLVYFSMKNTSNTMNKISLKRQVNNRKVCAFAVLLSFMIMICNGKLTLAYTSNLSRFYKYMPENIA